jgi:superfamily II DNA or RNA helicase
MNGPLPLTRKQLVDWAGERVFHDAETLVERGLVTNVVYEAPFVTGAILWSNRPLRTAVRILPDGTAENHCPCRDSTERGIICSHVIALCLHLLKRARNPEQEANRLRELRRAARMAGIHEAAYLRRARPETPGTVPAEIHLTLGAGWAQAAATGHIPVYATARIEGVEHPLDTLSRDICLGLSQADESVLFVLDDICEGPARSQIELSVADFVSLLPLYRGRSLLSANGHGPLGVSATPLTSFLRLDLDRETGELLLMLHTEIPFAHPGETPVYLVSGHHGWVAGGGHFWPVEPILPEPLHALYRGPVPIARPAVPAFVQTELPALQQFIRVETDLSADLFTIEPEPPRLRLVVRGSPASLAATLHADYGDATVVAGKTNGTAAFAHPDPRDLMRYTVRNPPAETRALEILSRFGLAGECGDKLNPVVGCREVLNFLGSQVPALRRLGWRVELEGRIAGFMEQQQFVTPVVRVSAPPSGSRWFEVGFDFEGPDGARLNPADVQRALLKGDSFLQQGDRTVLLDGHAIAAMNDVFEDCAGGEGSRPGTFRLSSIYAAYVKASLDALDGVDVEATPDWAAAAEGRRAEQAAPVTLTDALETVLRPYQKDGVRWLRMLENNGFCGILADEMGLGKTLQTLAWLQMERSHPEAQGQPSLIVCPTSLVENWAEEARRFTPSLRVLTIAGSDRHGKWAAMGDHDVVITSYALLRRDVENYLDTEFAAVILDEAQHIKNRSTLNAITAKQLHAYNRLVLTGTPMENSVADLWSIMDFLMPGYLGGHEHFRRHYELAIAAGGLEADAAQVKLRRKLAPFLMRRMKTDVASDLPARIERLASCSLSGDQRIVYRQLLESSRRELADLVRSRGLAQCRMEVLRTLMRLRQACCHLGLLPMPDLHPEQPSAKMDLLFELLDEALDGGHRILVFSQFVSMLTILRGELDRRQVAYSYLDGSTKERQAVVHEFNRNRRIPVFLISLKAGGVGLNLTGADMVIHYDPWWNPAVEDQATDRAHRIGQKRTVYSVKLITKGTVEEKILALQKRKQALIRATITAEDRFVDQLSFEEIMELLQLDSD